MNIKEITDKYLDHAIAILSEKAGKEEGFY